MDDTLNTEGSLPSTRTGLSNAKLSMAEGVYVFPAMSEISPSMRSNTRTPLISSATVRANFNSVRECEIILAEYCFSLMLRIKTVEFEAISSEKSTVMDTVIPNGAIPVAFEKHSATHGNTPSILSLEGSSTPGNSRIAVLPASSRMAPLLSIKELIE